LSLSGSSSSSFGGCVKDASAVMFRRFGVGERVDDTPDVTDPAERRRLSDTGRLGGRGHSSISIGLSGSSGEGASERVCARVILDSEAVVVVAESFSGELMAVVEVETDVLRLGTNWSEDEAEMEGPFDEEGFFATVSLKLSLGEVVSQVD